LHAINLNASYVIFNTGAHWLDIIFRWRQDWCNWQNWTYLTLEELVKLYKITFITSITNNLLKLQSNGIKVIYLDTSPGGITFTVNNSFVGLNYHRTFSVYNEIARDLVVQSGGLLLPIWDLSFARQIEHIFQQEHYFDWLHWCNFHDNSVPATWVQLLYNVIYDDLVKNEPFKSSEELMHLFPNHNAISKEDLRLFIERNQTNKTLDSVPFAKSTETKCSCAANVSLFQCHAKVDCVWSNNQCYQKH